MSVLGDNDGWHFVPNNENQHYFYREHSLCGLFNEKPEGSHHDNDPKLHCEKCTQTQRKLMQVAQSIAGKKMSAKEVLDLITNLDKIINSKGLIDKVKTPENVVAVITKQNGEKKTFEAGPRRKTKVKTQ